MFPYGLRFDLGLFNVLNRERTLHIVNQARQPRSLNADQSTCEPYRFPGIRDDPGRRSAVHEMNPKLPHLTVMITRLCCCPQTLRLVLGAKAGL